MSIQDKIARGILQCHGDILDNFNKQADGWWTEIGNKHLDNKTIQYSKCKIAFGKNQSVVISCDVADTPDLQTIGLQKHASLGETDGMVFPYETPRRVSFHMADVQFPIDIIFVGGDGRVTKKIEDIEPGAQGSWGMPHTIAVIETNGGFCKKHSIEVGEEVFELADQRSKVANLEFVEHGGMKWVLTPDADAIRNCSMGGVKCVVKFSAQANKYWIEDIHNGNLLAGPVNSEEELEGLGARLSNRHAQEKFPRYPRKDVNPKMLQPNETKDRFKDRDLVDVQTSSQPMSNRHDETLGYDVTKSDDIATSPVRPGK